VLVRGLAEEVTGAHRADLVARTQAVGVQPWAPGEYGSWLRIIAHGISGRRITPGQLPRGVDDAPTCNRPPDLATNGSWARDLGPRADPRRTGHPRCRVISDAARMR
jgi:hypothetical protein